jgi:hypothetical protein
MCYTEFGCGFRLGNPSKAFGKAKWCFFVRVQTFVDQRADVFGYLL